MSQYLSVFDMLKIGVGPSSSHTLGPWKAAALFVNELESKRLQTSIDKIRVTLYGSLALTGKGHATDKAIVLGLSNEDPETIEISKIGQCFEQVLSEKRLSVKNQTISFDPASDILYLKSESLPFHSNALKFEAFNKGVVISSEIYYSIGGGFLVKEGESPKNTRTAPKYVFNNAEELKSLCAEMSCSISDIVLENEKSWKDETLIRQDLLKIWDVMREAAYEGCHTEGILPGGLKVKRRAAEMNKQLLRVNNYSNSSEWIEAMKVGRDFRKVITRISCLAIAVNEVNASMSRIVTAPTNGSAGVLPAVLLYFICFSGKEVGQEEIIRFLLTAGEIAKFFKNGATISAAAGGCQAEIGVSSSMAAAALTEGMGGSPSQALMAAEIAAEHHLGLTCDPVAGLVQIPCIERNSMGAVKAITATMIALASDPAFAKVSLDNLIKTMKETAENMSSNYKETSLGGLAVHVGVNIPEC